MAVLKHTFVTQQKCVPAFPSGVDVSEDPSESSVATDVSVRIGKITSRIATS